MVDQVTELLKIVPYRREAKQLSGWAVLAALVALAAFATSAYIGMSDAGWKLLILGIVSSFCALLLFGRIAEQEQTADVIQTIYELSSTNGRANVA